MAGKKRSASRERTRPLRQRAEELLRASSPDISGMSAKDIRTLLHELQVHQIELELQNEELRQAQLELAFSRDRYSDLYEFAPVGYVTLDDKGRILESNLTAAVMVGAERTELAGTAISRFVAPESQDNCYLHLQAVFASGAKHICELDLRRKDGTMLAVRLESVVQQSATAEPRRCRTAVIDIADVRAARQQLQQLNEELERRVKARTFELRLRTDQLAWESAELQRNEHEFRTLADNVPALFGYVGPDQRYRYVNRRYEEFWQRPATDIVGKTIAELLGPQTFEAVRPHVEAVLLGQQTIYETEFDPPNGGRRTLQVRLVPSRDEDGKVQGFFALLADTTDRARAEQMLRESEERLRSILNTAADAIVTLDRRGIIDVANPAAERMFGYTRDELVGQKITLLMPVSHSEPDSKSVIRYLEADKAGGTGYGRETVVRRKDGSTFPVEVAVSEVEHLGLFTAIIRDVTERKKTEQQLAHYRKDLRTMSSELMLTEERERQRLAQDLHDGLGQSLFRARMKLDRGIVSDDDVREIGTILDDVGKMVNTLTFELSPPVLRQLGFLPAIKWLTRDLKQRYALSVRIDADSQTTIALDERVAVVLFRSVRELLINVAKHAQTDSASVSIRRLGSRLQVKVADHGRGFDLAYPSRHVEEGHFGLFSIRERIEYLDGAIQIQSAPGEGTTLTLTVPIATEAGKAQTG